MPSSRHAVSARIDVLVLCSFLDVRKRQSTVGIGDVDDSIEPRHRVTHMLCVGQCAASETRRRCQVSRSASSAIRVSREVSGLRLACLCHPFFKYLASLARGRAQCLSFVP